MTEGLSTSWTSFGYLTTTCPALLRSCSRSTSPAARAARPRRGDDGVTMVPAFPAIYGGYFVAFGAIYAGADFVNPDVVRARLAQFVYGSALAGSPVA